MNVLIAGGGRTGARLANLLINQNYNVRLIENRRELLGHLHQELPTEVIYEGNPADPRVLDQVGVREVQVVAACTTEDSDNLAICYIARKLYNVPRTIARINNPRNAWLFSLEMGIDVALNQADLMGHLIAEEMTPGTTLSSFEITTILGGQYSEVCIADPNRPQLAR